MRLRSGSHYFPLRQRRIRADRRSSKDSAGGHPVLQRFEYPPLPQVHIPEPETFTSYPTECAFSCSKITKLPIIDGFALVRTEKSFRSAGQARPRGDHGKRHALWGTHAKTGDQLDEELENIAASVESNLGETSATVSFSALKETVDSVLQTFKGVLTEPEFRQDKIDLLIAQVRSGIARRNDDAQAIAERELTAVLYGRNTPYGWQVEYENLDRIHREDLQQFYRRYYFPKNVMLAVYGDFSTNEMKDKLERIFGDWKAEQTPVPPFPTVTAKADPGIFLGEKTDVTQTFFAIGSLGGTLRDPDYPALQVASSCSG